MTMRSFYLHFVLIPCVAAIAGRKHNKNHNSKYLLHVTFFYFCIYTMHVLSTINITHIALKFKISSSQAKGTTVVPTKSDSDVMFFYKVIGDL